MFIYIFFGINFNNYPKPQQGSRILFISGNYLKYNSVINLLNSSGVSKKSYKLFFGIYFIYEKKKEN